MNCRCYPIMHLQYLAAPVEVPGMIYLEHKMHRRKDFSFPFWAIPLVDGNQVNQQISVLTRPSLTAALKLSLTGITKKQSLSCIIPRCRQLQVQQLRWLFVTS